MAALLQETEPVRAEIQAERPTAELQLAEIQEALLTAELQTVQTAAITATITGTTTITATTAITENNGNHYGNDKNIHFLKRYKSYRLN
jgi:hypothetical protein